MKASGGKQLRVKRSFASSVAVHALLFLALWRWVAGAPPIPSVTPAARTYEVELEADPSARAAHARPRAASARPRAFAHTRLRPRPSPGKHLTLRDLAPPGVDALSKGPSSPAPNAEPDAATGLSSPYGFEDQLPAKTNPILTYLYRRIDGGIAFPAELTDAGISGEVSAKLEFDSSGQWIDSPQALKAQDLGGRYLRVYVLRRLREVLAEPLPENLWRANPHPLDVEAHFEFAIVAPESVESAQFGPTFERSTDPSKFGEVDHDANASVEGRLASTRQGQYGRKFFFYRVHLASPLAWKLGPLAGYGIMPSVGIDPSWFVEKFKDIVHHRAKIDPLDRYRDDPDW